MAEENTNTKSTGGEKTVQDVIDSMTEEQRTVLFMLFVGQALEEKENEEGDNKEMKHNVFSDNNNDNYTADTISHAEIVAAIGDAKDTAA